MDVVDPALVEAKVSCDEMLMLAVQEAAFDYGYTGRREVAQTHWRETLSLPRERPSYADWSLAAGKVFVLLCPCYGGGTSESSLPRFARWRAFSRRMTSRQVALRSCKTSRHLFQILPPLRICGANRYSRLTIVDLRRFLGASKKISWRLRNFPN